MILIGIAICNPSRAAKMSYALNCRLLHIEVLSIRSKFERKKLTQCQTAWNLTRHRAGSKLYAKALETWTAGEGHRFLANVSSKQKNHYVLILLCFEITYEYDSKYWNNKLKEKKDSVRNSFLWEFLINISVWWK